MWTVSNLLPEFILPWKQGQLLGAVSKFHVLCHWLEFCIPVHLSVKLDVAARPQLHLQQRDLPDLQQCISSRWLAM